MKTIRIASVVVSALLVSVGIAGAADQQKPVKPHSHMEEKTNMPSQAPKAKKAEEKPQQSADKAAEKTDKDTSGNVPGKDKHYHPRDGK